MKGTWIWRERGEGTSGLRKRVGPRAPSALAALPLLAGPGTRGELLETFLSPPHPLLGESLGAEVRFGAGDRGEGGWCSAEPDFAQGRSMK